MAKQTINYDTVETAVASHWIPDDDNVAFNPPRHKPARSRPPVQHYDCTIQFLNDLDRAGERHFDNAIAWLMHVLGLDEQSADALIQKRKPTAGGYAAEASEVNARITLSQMGAVKADYDLSDQPYSACCMIYNVKRAQPIPNNLTRFKPRAY